uniref:Uncharacterized protein n=1 Tax=Arundo donax TaxID=35708 RepID=A0A0A9FTA9_ARUDO
MGKRTRCRCSDLVGCRFRSSELEFLWNFCVL